MAHYKVGDVLAYKETPHRPFYTITAVFSKGSVDMTYGPNNQHKMHDVSRDVLDLSLVLCLPREVVESPLYKALNE